MDYSRKPIKLCTRCGVEFISDTPDRICKDCKSLKRMPSYTQINARLLEDCRNADKLGISYGVYKASEKIWVRKFKLKTLEEQKK